VSRKISGSTVPHDELRVLVVETPRDTVAARRSKAAYDESIFEMASKDAGKSTP
jgi:hypothetical protein